LRSPHKTTTILVAAAMLMALGTGSALANRGGGDDGDGDGGGGRERVTICHRTRSATNPWRKITVSRNALPAHERHGDTFPDAQGNCPGADIPDGGGNGGGDDDDNGHDHDHDGDRCSSDQDAENESGDVEQRGLLNVNAALGLNVLLSNILCQADFLNDVVDLPVAVLGTATNVNGGDADGGDDDGVFAESRGDDDDGGLGLLTELLDLEILDGLLGSL
jgi:hypothetical protein